MSNSALVESPEKHPKASRLSANDRSQKSTLCAACAGITIQALIRPEGYTHVQNALDLLELAKTCPLCHLIRLAIAQDKTKPPPDELLQRIIAQEPVVMYGISDGIDTEDASSQSAGVSPKIYGINVHVPDRESGFDIAYLSLVADPGSSADLSKDVIGRPVLSDSGSPEALELVKTWYKSCTAEHMACKELFTGIDASNLIPQLPTRVLDLGPCDGTDDLRLFVTEGAKARYAALSHCWGKHRLLTTTTQNVLAHRQCIKLNSLPKTFQDAVKIARSLDLRYLWIDSLCIIQDDAEDWRKESVQMGRIYQNAAITIAASGARDGSEGCLTKRPSSMPLVPLLYKAATHESGAEYVYATLFPDQAQSSLTQAPLGSRAWITQEWMLSPRTIHYTKARMAWACRTHVKCEDGYTEPPMDEQRLFDSIRQYRDSKIQGNLNAEARDDFLADWCEMVSTYTSRDLTFESDKPIAILGLATEIKESVHETYIAGLFCNSLDLKTGNDSKFVLSQLFWFPKIKLTRPTQLHDQPSWSWTSTVGAVSFFPVVKTSQSKVKNLRFEQDGFSAAANPSVKHTTKLHFSSQIKQWGGEKSWLGTAPPPGTPITMYFFSRSMIYNAGGVNSRNLFLFLGPDQNPAGWVTFDLGIWPSPETRLFVALMSASEMDGKTDGFNVMFLEEIVDASYQGSVRTFTRLGVGEIIDMRWFDDVAFEDILLI